MPNIGPLEIAVVLIVALVVFGPRRIPELGRSLGKGIRDFRSSLGGDDGEKTDEDPRDEELPRRLPTSASATGVRPRSGRFASRS